jgi:hypothetical protein
MTHQATHALWHVAACASAYRHSEYEFARRVPTFPKTLERRTGWKFLAVEPPMKGKKSIETAHTTG